MARQLRDHLAQATGGPFKVTEVKDVDVEERGYKAIHIKGVYKTRDGDLLCEIQIRTALEDAWGVVTRSDIYDGGERISDDVREDARNLAKVLQGVDGQFETLLKRVRESPRDPEAPKASSEPALVESSVGDALEDIIDIDQAPDVREVVEPHEFAAGEEFLVPPHTPEDEYILQQPVSEERKLRFLEKFIADRRQVGTLDSLFQRVGALERSSQGGPDGGLGYNTLVPKGPFVEGSNFLDLPTWDLAIGIEFGLARQLEEALRAATDGRLGVVIEADAQAIVQAADEMAEELSEAGYTPTVFILVGRPSVDLAVALTYLVTPDWELKGILRMGFKILGAHRDVPIVEIDQGGAPAFYAVDLAKFARLRRFGSRPEFALNEIDAEEAAELLEENPGLIKEPPPVPGMENERVRKVLLQLHLRLYERHELVVQDRSAVVGRPVNYPSDE